MSKKVISLLLAVMLTMAMIAVAAVSVSADTDDEGRYVPSEGTKTYRIYFYKPAYWENEFASDTDIFWQSGSDSPSAFPGYCAQKADVPNVYYCDVPTDVDNVIWNNVIDGADGSSNSEIAPAYKTTDIALVGYDAKKSDYYPEGVKNFDNMIYIINPDSTSVDDEGKSVCSGEWFYYYGNGEYGTVPVKEKLKSGDYYGEDGVFPTEYTSLEETTTAPSAKAATEPAATESGVESTAATSPSEASSLALTVNATSNYFPMATAQYNPTTNQVTVTYNLESAENVLDTQWYISYDTAILSLSKDNNVKSVCPVMNGKGAYVNLCDEDDGTGYVRFCASDLSLYNFSEKTPFARIVFDVKDISKVAPVSTTVDLVVQVLRVSELDPDTEMTDSDKEVVLVDKEIVKKDPVAAAKVGLSTMLTLSTYVEPATTTAPTTVETTEAPSTESSTATSQAASTEKPTQIPAQTSATEFVTEKINSTSDTPDTPDSNGGNDGVVQTGEAPLAVVILTLLIGSTCVMFVLRKKEEIL